MAYVGLPGYISYLVEDQIWLVQERSTVCLAISPRISLHHLSYMKNSSCWRSHQNHCGSGQFVLSSLHENDIHLREGANHRKKRCRISFSSQAQIIHPKKTSSWTGVDLHFPVSLGAASRVIRLWKLNVFCALWHHVLMTMVTAKITRHWEKSEKKNNNGNNNQKCGLNDSPQHKSS